MYGVFDLTNLSKGRKIGGGKQGAPLGRYRFTTKTGVVYDKSFFSQKELESAIKFAVKEGRKYERLDSPTPHHAEHVIATPLLAAEGIDLQDAPTVASSSEVAHARIEERAAPVNYVRLGDRVSTIDPKGATKAKELVKLGDKVSQLRDNIRGLLLREKTARTEGKDALALSYAKTRMLYEAQLRPAAKALDAMRLDLQTMPNIQAHVRLQAVKTGMRALRDASAAYIEENPEWWQGQLKQWKAAKRVAKRKGQAPPAKPKFAPQFLVDQPDGSPGLKTLAWRLRGLGGKAVAISREPAHVLAPGSLSHVARVEEAGGLDPDHNEVAYLLTRGEWPTRNADGSNKFSKTESEALRKEFAGDVRSIVDGGKMWNSAVGWAQSIRGFDAIRDDLYQRAYVKLFELAAEFTPEKAKELTEEGSNFHAYARRDIYRVINKTLKRHLEEKRVEADFDSSILDWDADADFGAGQLKDAGAPLETPYISGEDAVALTDTKRILREKLPPALSVALQSRLNLYNPTNEAGLKPWAAVAADMVEAEKVRGQRVGAEFALATSKRLLRDIFKPGGLDWAENLLPSERHALRSGLKLLLKYTESKSVTFAGTSSWRKEKTAEGEASFQAPKYEGVHRRVKDEKDPAKRLTSRFTTQDKESRFGGGQGVAHDVYTEMTRPRPTASKEFTQSKFSSMLPKDVASFWASRKHTLSGKVIDPAHEFGLGDSGERLNTLLRPASSKFAYSKPEAYRASHYLQGLKAQQYAKVWRGLAALPAEKLQNLHASKAVKAWETAWGAHQTTIADESRLASAKDREMKRLKAPVLRVHGVEVRGVSPADLSRMVSLIASERASSKRVAKSFYISKADDGLRDLLAKLLGYKKRKAA